MTRFEPGLALMWDWRRKRQVPSRAGSIPARFNLVTARVVEPAQCGGPALSHDWATIAKETVCVF